MGMFNVINFSMSCPNCGVEINEFQTKDGNLLLDIVEPDSVNNFYSSCDNCSRSGINTWIEFSRAPTNVPLRNKPATEDQIIAMGFIRKMRDF
jgi:hypothetical protein